MPNEKHAVPATDREWRVRWVRLQQIAAGEIDVPGTRYPATAEQKAAARKREVEVLAIEAGLPPPTWGGPAQSRRAEPIDDTPWRVSRKASLRAQHERFGRYGLALAHDGSLFCTRCREVVLARPRNRPFAMGAPVSAVAMRHAEATGCR